MSFLSKMCLSIEEDDLSIDKLKIEPLLDDMTFCFVKSIVCDEWLMNEESNLIWIISQFTNTHTYTYVCMFIYTMFASV